MAREELIKQSQTIIASMLNGKQLNVEELRVLAQFVGLNAGNKVLQPTESLKYIPPPVGNSYDKVIIGSYDKG